ncbi:flagellar assembly protein FliW [Tuberibacillus sp. Marseille-P3662]|uniref:flagellar assembly protein FliW n=1 Tax=Tuberibacillus sp. Marseille-P3662 TaxID=1965358 RepID=UPI000A1C7C28|nr:flagellar assembly protein FliW [Tuberibacillus sp. Marseille-P3662]
MTIETKYHGEMEINHDEAIHFDHGLPGFQHETTFVLLPLEQASPFVVLQSLNHPEVAFIMTTPFLFYPDYAFDLPEDAIDQLAIESEFDVTIYSILTIKEPFEDSTINLIAPVIINHQTKEAKQIVLQSDDYTTKHPLVSGKEGSNARS